MFWHAPNSRSNGGFAATKPDVMDSSATIKPQESDLAAMLFDPHTLSSEILRRTTGRRIWRNGTEKDEVFADVAFAYLEEVHHEFSTYASRFTKNTEVESVVTQQSTNAANEFGFDFLTGDEDANELPETNWEEEDKKELKRCFKAYCAYAQSYDWRANYPEECGTLPDGNLTAMSLLYFPVGKFYAELENKEQFGHIPAIARNGRIMLGSLPA